MLIQQNVQLIIRAANGIPAVTNVKKVCQFTRRSIYFKVKVTPIVCVTTLHELLMKCLIPQSWLRFM